MLLNWLSNPINSNSVGSGNISHWRPASLYDHLDHCFLLAFKDKQQNFLMRRLDVWRNKVNIIQNMEHSSRLPLHVIRITANYGFSRSVMVLSCVSNTKNQIQQIESGNTVFSQSCVQRDDFGFCWIGWNWSLSFTHPTYRNKCMTCKTHNVPPEVDFEHSRSLEKLES